MPISADQAWWVAGGLAGALLFVLLDGLRRIRTERSRRGDLEQRLGVLLEASGDLLAFADPQGRITYLNAAGSRLIGVSDDAVHADDAPVKEPWVRVLLRREALERAAKEGVWRGETELLTLTGRRLDLSLEVRAQRGPDGDLEFFSVIGRDGTEAVRLREQLLDERNRTEVTLGSIGDAVITTDPTGVVTSLNPAAELLTGWSEEEAKGQPADRVVSVIHEVSREPLDDPAMRCLREDGPVGSQGQTILVRKDGREFNVDYTAAPVRHRERKSASAVIVLKDVTQARALARQLSHQATHDALTGLVNRQEFERRLGRALTRAREDRAEHALCYLDLDQFKVVNDTCGHLAGDELLRQVGVTLRGKMRRRDTLARLGGDEFGVLLEHCKPDQARAIAEDLRQVLQDFHFAWEGRPFTVGVSIGVAPITIETESIAAILRDADSACYAAKEKGRNRVQVAQTGDLHLAVRQGELEWVSKVTEALGENRFRLYAQPIAPVIPHLQDHPHCEVLIRLLGPNGELALPGAFIPAAERYGIMPAVDRWVVERVVAYYGERASAPSAELPIISINLSGASLSDPTLFDFIRQQLLRGSVSPHSLCFEITETAAIANLAHAVQFIRELRKLGCSFALDDFGSGLSSFAYLQTLPVDYLKIAGSFVRHIATDPIDYAMVEAISRVGQVMGVRTIAEGVETESVMDKLKEIGVDYAQGWAISEPVPIEEIERVLITR